MNTNEFYQALVDKNSDYEGVFFVGVKTTAIFCRPTCTARKPKPQNCSFFLKAEDALAAGFRPCKRCQPLRYPNSENEVIQLLLQALAQDPLKRWRNEDIQQLSVDPSTARRHFKRRFGMTFSEYARTYRMGYAHQQLQGGTSVMDAQVQLGYDSASGFREAFTKIVGNLPSQTQQTNVLYSAWVDTPLGAMVALADESALMLLEFVDRDGLEAEIRNLQKALGYGVVTGENVVLQQLRDDLARYFDGTLHDFTTPYQVVGTDFQKQVWAGLATIPYGETRSYRDMATALGNPAAVRAVARANASNKLAIIIPCHRVISSSGELAGYAGGVARKRWLLEHERLPSL
ncbi:MAG: bifunctional transcriptional activator/DNA repair enzyme AdaA [Phototrophicaceae bacterium]